MSQRTTVLLCTLAIILMVFLTGKMLQIDLEVQTSRLETQTDVWGRYQAKWFRYQATLTGEGIKALDEKADRSFELRKADGKVNQALMSVLESEIQGSKKTFIPQPSP